VNIVIIGAGAVGSAIARRLVSENKKVVVVDIDTAATDRLENTLDVKTVRGSGSSPAVLREAGVTGADLFLAVTHSDEVNLMACLMTQYMSPDTRKLARIRNAEFDPLHTALQTSPPNIDTIINPEAEVVNTIRKLMVVPGAVDVGSFIDGRVKYTGAHINANAPVIGMRLADYPAAYGSRRPLIAAVIRKNEVIVPHGNDAVQAGDIVYFVSETGDFDAHLAIFGLTPQTVRSALILGGGKIGERLALSLESEGIHTKIIERDARRCAGLSSRLNKTVVLNGDGSDLSLLREENIGRRDVVVSVTGDDETNILVSLLASNLGVCNTITRIGNPGYFPLLSTIGIKKIVSPRLSAISSILHEVRKGQVLSDISIFGEKGEFIEAVAVAASGITGRCLKDIRFPSGALLVCIARGHEVIIPDGDTPLLDGDRMILFAVKKALADLEALLTVSLEYI